MFVFPQQVACPFVQLFYEFEAQNPCQAFDLPHPGPNTSPLIGKPCPSQEDPQDVQELQQEYQHPSLTPEAT